MKVWIFDHAVLRFQERVRPGLDFVAASKELRRLLDEFGVRVERPAWCPESDDNRFYVQVCDDVVVVCQPSHRLPQAVTVLAKGSMSEEWRERRNERRRNRPSARTRKLADRGRPSSRGDFVPSIEF